MRQCLGLRVCEFNSDCLLEKQVQDWNILGAMAIVNERHVDLHGVGGTEIESGHILEEELASSQPQDR